MAGTDGAAVAAEIRTQLMAFHTQRDPQLLTSAVARAEALATAPGFTELDEPTRAFVWTLGAAALTWRARTAHAQPDDLDRAIEWTDRAVGTWPSNDPADLERALPLFDVAIAQLRADGERVDVALHSQGVCYHERATAVGGQSSLLRCAHE